MTKQLVRIGLGVMVTLLALVVLWQFRTVVIYVLISLILAATLRPLVNRLVGRGKLARLAWILLYLVILVGLGFLLFLLEGLRSMKSNCLLKPMRCGMSGACRHI